MRRAKRQARATILYPSGCAGRQEGSALLVAIVFTAVFLMVGVSLYWLITAQTRSTDTERTDVKSFNVAEAGVDAGMLTLKLAWPRSEAMAIDMTDYNDSNYNLLLKTAIQNGTDGLLDPSRSDPSEFIQVLLYDDIDSATGETTTIADPDAPKWDSNRNGVMFVDATSNVDDDRHRILIMAERESWGLDFEAYAIVTPVVDSNGQGLRVRLEDGDGATAFVGSSTHKETDYGDGVTESTSAVEFGDLITDGLVGKLMMIAQASGSYFEGADAGDDASDFLASGQGNGKVVYVKSDSAVEISANVQDHTVGTVDFPAVVIIDTPDGSENGWDMKGNAEFYGVLIVLGDTTLRGTCGVHGSLYCNGTLVNKGAADAEISYNQSVINNINDQYTLAVRLVPNTWEEYTLKD